MQRNKIRNKKRNLKYPQKPSLTRQPILLQQTELITETILEEEEEVVVVVAAVVVNAQLGKLVIKHTKLEKVLQMVEEEEVVEEEVGEVVAQVAVQLAEVLPVLNIPQTIRLKKSANKELKTELAAEEEAEVAAVAIVVVAESALKANPQKLLSTMSPNPKEKMKSKKEVNTLLTEEDEAVEDNSSDTLALEDPTKIKDLVLELETGAELTMSQTLLRL